MLEGLFLPAHVKGFDGVTQMGDNDAAPDNKGHVEGIVKGCVVPAGLDALQDVIVDAVIAAQYHGGHQPEEFLSAAVEGAVFVGFGVQVEEALDAQVIDLQDAIIHAAAVGFKFVESGHFISP